MAEKKKNTTKKVVELTEEEMQKYKEFKKLYDDKDLEIFKRHTSFDESIKSDLHIHLFNQSMSDNAHQDLLIGQFESAQDAGDSWYLKVIDTKIFFVFQKREAEGDKCPYEGKTFQALYKSTERCVFEILKTSKLPIYLPVKDYVTYTFLENTTDINLENDGIDPKKQRKQEINEMWAKNNKVKEMIRNEEKTKQAEEDAKKKSAGSK